MEKKLQFPVLQEAELKGKIVLVRVDHNVVKKGLIHDPYRIDSTFATLGYILAKGGKLILMTHVGRPKDKKAGTINCGKDTSVAPVVDYIHKKLGIKLQMPVVEETDGKGLSGVGESIKTLVGELRENRIDGIYLPNTRWFSGEESKGDEADIFARELASIADVYVNDAFGSWQAHASTAKVAQYLPSYAGLLMQKEVINLDRIFSPDKPFVSVVAGSKFDTKIDSLNALLKVSDHLILGGVIYNAYLCAKYGIQINGIESDDLEHAKAFVEFTKQYPGKLVEMPYIVESDSLEGRFDGQYRTHNIKDLKPGTKLNFVLDAAKESFNEPGVMKVFSEAKTVFVNAVMGLTPHFNEGTIALDTIIHKNKEAMKLFGGGDTLQEMKRLVPGIYMSAVDDPKYYLFTGGGAVLKAIQENSVMGIEPLKALQK